MLNKNEWISGLLEDYKRDLNEKKINLDDDYIKFIRFGQWRIQQTGQGILAFITNNSFIDGLTHRRMRQSLMETFTDIYILNLHGSSKKQKKAPDGSKDENVFDIQQGVSISLFVKESGKTGPARVHHAELWGTRESKYAILSRSDISSIQWAELQPRAEGFFFVPRNEANKAEYMKGWSVPDIFTLYNSAIQTKKDALTIHFTRQQLESVLKDIKTKDPETLRNAYDLGPDGPAWSVAAAKKDVMQSKGQICQVQYRPFDLRWTYFTGNTGGFLGRPRADITSQLLQPNIALATVRQIAGVPDLCEVFVTNHTMTDRSMFSTLGTPYLFPLYTYTTSDNTAGTLFAQTGTTRTPNLAPEFVKAFGEKLGLTFISDGKGDAKKTFGPEDVFHYAYAVFHSPTYRERYAEFLKIDFPRLPLTSDKKLFAKLAAKGAELFSLHLLKAPTLDSFVTTFPVSGTNTVEKVRYDASRKKVWINDEQYFGGLPENIWEFQVGGYQVCDKWLKDRKGRTLSADDIRHYQRVVVALKATIRIMAEIDKVIPGWPLP
ncbi:MAG: hypothetical protein HY872_06135 [Chloroflexi bacterium]|nr:hypothetical protein [Chloroflexota bacterium]